MKVVDILEINRVANDSRRTPVVVQAKVTLSVVVPEQFAVGNAEGRTGRPGHVDCVVSSGLYVQQRAMPFAAFGRPQLLTVGGVERDHAAAHHADELSVDQYGTGGVAMFRSATGVERHRPLAF